DNRREGSDIHAPHATFSWATQMLRSVLGVFLFCVGSFCYALLGILSQLSKSPDGSYAYSLPSVVLLAEITKLVISFCLLTARMGGVYQALQDVLRTSPKSWLAFAFPSALYSLNNNLDMLNNQHMDPATEQVLVQAKILTTGLVWWWVFGREMGFRKWCGLLLLFLGAVSAGWPSDSTLGKRMHIDSFGVVLVILYVWVSASAGVYNEWLYKGIGKDDNIHTCNIRIYVIGSAVNLAAHLSHKPVMSSLFSLTEGYNQYCWALVVTYSLMGLLLAQVMKFFDSIVKLFISGSSMYVSAVLSGMIFGYTPTWNFLAGMALVTFAMVLYNLEHIKLFLTKPKEQ
ncbi:Probable UDP-sugar transporter protein SLC35A4 (Solute carrier family 35 member A4), partial [Durusdinium trenchii]